MDMLFTHDVNYGRQGKGDEANAASSGGLAAAGEPSQIREPGAAPASEMSQFELNSALAGFFSQPIGGSGASSSKVPEPAFTAAPAPAYEPVAVPEAVASAAPEPAFAHEPVPDPAFAPTLEPVLEPAPAYEPAPTFAFESAPAPEPVSQLAPTPAPEPTFEPALAFASVPEPVSQPTPAPAPEAAPEPEVTSIPSLDFSFSAQPEPQVDAQPTTQVGQGFTPTTQSQEPFVSNVEFSYQPEPEPAAAQPPTFEPAPAMPDPASAVAAAQPTAEYATTPLPESTSGSAVPLPEPATGPAFASQPAVAAAASPEPVAVPTPTPAANLTPQPVFVPEPARSEEPEAAQVEKGARRMPKVPVLATQSVPTKRSINLIEATKRRLNKRSIAITAIVAVVALALIGKFGVFDPYSHLAQARSNAAQLQSEVARANLEIDAMGELVDTYAHYTYSGMTSDELTRADRAEILEMIERVIMPRATLSSWSVKGDTLTTSITANSLQDINAVAQLVNEEEIVNYCSVVTASNGTMNASGQDSGRVTANIVVYLNPNDEGVRI